jgi:shikimate kinase
MESSWAGIVVAIITSLGSLAGVIITVAAQSKKFEESMKVSQAVTDTKLEELTREVRAHNGFAQRLPVVENDVKTIYKRLDRIESQGNDGK